MCRVVRPGYHTCIENNEWVRYSKANATLNASGRRHHHVPGRGDTSIQPKINLFDGKIANGEGWGNSSPEAIVCSREDSFWIAHYAGVSRFNGQGWQTYPVQGNLTTDPEAYDLVNDIALAPDGGIWVVTTNSVAVFADESWTVYEEGSGFDDKYFFENIALDSQGHPWVISSNGLFSYDGLFWEFHPSPEAFTPQGIVVDNQNRVWVGTFSGGLFIFENESWLKFTPQNSALSSNNVQAFATDATGRVWIGTTWGLHVVDGDTWTGYQMNNSDLADDDVVAIAVSARGPACPRRKESARRNHRAACRR